MTVLRKRIPTLLALLLLVGSAFLGVLFIDQGTSFIPRANPDHEPQHVTVTNVSDNRFTVSWVTKEPAEGFVLYGTDSSRVSTRALDERDQLSGDTGLYRTHSVTVTGLVPKTVYYAKVGSNNAAYEVDGQNLQIITGPAIPLIPAADTAYGQVFWHSGEPAEGVLVYIYFGPEVDGGVLSALTKRDGSWVIPLALARTSTLERFVSYQADSSLVITTKAGVGSEVVKGMSVRETKPVEPVSIVK